MLIVATDNRASIEATPREATELAALLGRVAERGHGAELAFGATSGHETARLLVRIDEWAGRDPDRAA